MNKETGGRLFLSLSSSVSRRLQRWRPSTEPDRTFFNTFHDATLNDTAPSPLLLGFCVLGRVFQAQVLPSKAYHKIYL